jgi:hypothetical protein
MRSLLLRAKSLDDGYTLNMSLKSQSKREGHARGLAHLMSGMYIQNDRFDTMIC